MRAIGLPRRGGGLEHDAVDATRRPVVAPVQGTVVAIAVGAGDAVHAEQELVVIESMKLEHAVRAPGPGIVSGVTVDVGQVVMEGDELVVVEASDAAAVGTVAGGTDTPAAADASPALDEVRARHAVGLDAGRSEAVARRHATGRRTARENVEDLCDPGSFVEYGPLVVAAQRRRRDLDDLVRNTPADGLVGGLGTVGGQPTVVLSYDYTVLAGTQGFQNHRKKDRLFELAARRHLPLVLFAEGGGGRPGDTDAPGFSGLDCLAFSLFSELSGLVPLVGVVGGRCFAGNAALLGCCDVVIATESSNIGMGGPAMIEGGGLGVYEPDEIGPASVQWENGVIDVLVADDAAAVDAARRYLAYFQGDVEAGAHDSTRLRGLVPENRRRAYDVRAVVAALLDAGSFLELRRGFGRGMVTGLGRVEGRALGVVANDPTHLGGAIDPDGADKAARFMQLC
ncbi:MAG TPA: carboxyl transferase domain-containing protein, partial [Acidimicrobiia bacterium]|nr:carboxyl transferase domain-containing protein [Acidimicrobiia bacterium]